MLAKHIDNKWLLKNGKECYIRWMLKRDLAEIMPIEQSTDFPLSEEDICRILRERNCIGMVVESCTKGSPIIGFMVYALHKHKLEILNLAVHPKRRRLRVGAAMIEKLITKLSSHRRTRIVCTLRESNLGGHLFLKACGMEAVSVDHGHFASDCGEAEDGYRFVLRIPAECEEEHE